MSRLASMLVALLALVGCQSARTGAESSAIQASAPAHGTPKNVGILVFDGLFTF